MTVVSTLEVLINGNNAGLTRSLRDSSGQLDGYERSFGERLTRLGNQSIRLGAQITAITAPFVAFGVQGIQVASDFESVMVEIGVRAGLTADELEQVRQTSLQLGADTAFSAQQAADAFLQLLTSGQSAEEALSTLPAVLDAAAASGEELGRTADGVTDILAAFRLPVQQSARVVDILARAAGASSADMGDLFEAFSSIGGVAAQFGISAEDTAAIFAIFAENGVKGAEAGTQLKSMLLAMNRETEDVADAWNDFGTSMYDAEGNMRPIAAVLADIEAAAALMTSEERNKAFQALAGSYGIMGLTALTAGGDMETMLTAMDGSASAADVAAARMDTFAGASDALKGSIETLQIEALTPFMNETLTPLIEELTGTINKITEWTKANPEATQTIITMVGALAIGGIALMGFGMFLNTAGVAVGFLGGAVKLLIGGALLPFIPILLLIGGMFLAYQNNVLGFRDRINELGETMRNAITTAQQLLTILQQYGLLEGLGMILNAAGPAPGSPNNANSNQLIGSLEPKPHSQPKARADGGSVFGGTPYLVGERGPELFLPGRSGSIVPNDQLGGDVYHINIMMPSDALRSPEMARKRGNEFGEALMERHRQRG